MKKILLSANFLSYGNAVRSWGQRLSLILFFFLLSTGFALAQKQISGVITDGDGATLPGVNIMVKGTTNGTISDLDGKFVLSAKAEDVLVFTFIGYKIKEVPVGQGTELKVTMDIETSNLEEVIVVGYGVKKKSVVTGAISSVRAEDLEAMSSVRADQAIQGKTAGVSILPTSGSPGAGTKIRIRGTNSNGDSNPLFIVDGMKTGDINNIDPGDIANIEVLKDAASCAIYGTEGANGVVLVTTKSGKKGTSKINYNFSYGIQSARTKMELMNAEQYKTWMTEAGDSFDDQGADTDWMSEMFQAAPLQKHHISFSGGSEKTTYLISGSYLDQDGIIGGDKANYNRLTTRLNIKSDVKDWLQVGANISYAHSNQKYIGEDDEYGGLVTRTLLMEPTVPVAYGTTPSSVETLLKAGHTLLMNGDGQYYGLNSAGEITNPIAALETYQNSIKQDKVLGSAFATIKPIKGLTITSRIGIDLAYQQDHSWTPKYYFNSENNNTAVTLSDNNNLWYTWLWENFASYNFKYGEHDFTVLGGISAQQYKGNWYGMNSSMIAEGDQFAIHTGGKGENDQVASTYGESTMASVFGRLSYNYKEKYLFEATVRRDGASEFPTDNQYAVFPSVSGGWILSSEEFFKVDFIDHLKLRASWGMNGNRKNLSGGEDISYWIFGGKYPNASDQFLNGARVTKLANADLVWEKTKMTDLGIDMRFLNSKLNVSVGYYNKLTEGLLATGSGPLSVGSDYPVENVGDIRNNGFDLELSFRNSDNAFKYGASVNLSTVNNNVERLAVDAPVVGDNLRGYDLTWFQQDQPIWYFRGYKTDGINPENGEVNVVDTNNDGEITSSDVTYIGDPHADFLFGGNLFASYKGFDFNLAFQGSYGNDIFMGWYRTDRTNTNKPAYFYEDRWTPSNKNASFPAANNVDDYVYRSDLMIGDGSYLRIKQIQVGYKIPKDLLAKAKIGSARVYISLDDYFTFTKYKGMDPEAGSSNNARQGIDRGLYPLAGKFMFGLSVSL